MFCESCGKEEAFLVRGRCNACAFGFPIPEKIYTSHENTERLATGVERLCSAIERLSATLEIACNQLLMK